MYSLSSIYSEDLCPFAREGHADCREDLVHRKVRVQLRHPIMFIKQVINTNFFFLNKEF